MAEKLFEWEDLDTTIRERIEDLLNRGNRVLDENLRGIDPTLADLFRLVRNATATRAGMQSGGLTMIGFRTQLRPVLHDIEKILSKIDHEEGAD